MLTCAAFIPFFLLGKEDNLFSVFKQTTALVYVGNPDAFLCALKVLESPLKCIEKNSVLGSLFWGGMEDKRI